MCNLIIEFTPLVLDRSSFYIYILLSLNLRPILKLGTWGENEFPAVGHLSWRRIGSNLYFLAWQCE